MTAGIGRPSPSALDLRVAGRSAWSNHHEQEPQQDGRTFADISPPPRPPDSFGEAIDAVVEHGGIKYKWHHYRGDGEAGYEPSDHVTWTEKGVTFKLSQSHGNDRRWDLRATSDGGYATFTWSASTWLEVPEVVRRPVERACRVITEDAERVRVLQERKRRETAAAAKAYEETARKRLLEQLED